MKTFLFKQILKPTKNKTFYSLVIKNKFRTPHQPGYSRYNWDDFGDTSQGFKVI
jgi:hypothetical protein